MRDIDITLTAVQEPWILEAALASIRRYVASDDVNLRLLVNIDPVGEGTADDTEKVCQQYFQHRLVRRPAKPSLNEALKWLWRQAQTDIVLHWEDDHVAERPINLPAMLDVFSVQSNLAYLQLPRISFTDLIDSQLLQHQRWQDEMYRRCGQYRMSLQCSLIRRAFIAKAADMIHLRCDPEIQFHTKNTELQAWTDKWEYATWVKPGDSRAVRHIRKRRRPNAAWQKMQSNRGTIWERKT